MSKLDKFYTNNTTVESILHLTQLNKYFTPTTLILEPSGGNGAFVEPLSKNHTVVSYDISPEHKNIISLDFLKLDVEKFNNETIKYTNIVVVGNPPFGKTGSMAIKFFNKCAEIHRVSIIAFIFPKSFKKDSMKNKLSLMFDIEYQMDLKENSFLVDNKPHNVPCVFQIWKRQQGRREKSSKNICNGKYEFTTSPNKGDIAIRRVGFYAGKASIIDNIPSKQSHIFIKSLGNTTNERIVSSMNSISWDHNNTTGPRSISKNEFIKYLNTIIT